MKIIAVGWNYRGHNAEMNQKETPKMNALCIDVNPRNSSSTATNEFIS